MSDAPLQPRPVTLPATHRSAVSALPRQQASWVAAQTVSVAALGAAGLWAVEPSLAMTLGLGCGVAVIERRRLWAAPLVVAMVVAGGLVAEALRVPAIVGAGAVAGLLAAWLVPQVATWLDHLNGALATAAGASLGLWAATRLLPPDVSPVLAGSLTALLTGLVASQGLVPLALRFDAIRPPTRREIRKALAAPYRAPVERAVALYEEAERRQAPVSDTRRGLCEVTHWVFRLQVSMQELDRELKSIDVADVGQRIADCLREDPLADDFTRERRKATAEHLSRLLEHRRGLETERTRTEALVGYALAFLEEARAGLALARQLPGEHSPDRLPEVLDRLRAHAAEGDARRRTQRELQAL